LRQIKCCSHSKFHFLFHILFSMRNKWDAHMFCYCHNIPRNQKGQKPPYFHLLIAPSPFWMKCQNLTQQPWSQRCICTRLVLDPRHWKAKAERRARMGCQGGRYIHACVSLCRGTSDDMFWLQPAPKSACAPAEQRRFWLLFTPPSRSVFNNKPPPQLSLNLQSRLSICAAEVRERICARRAAMKKNLYSCEWCSLVPNSRGPERRFAACIFGRQPRINSEWTLSLLFRAVSPLFLSGEHLGIALNWLWLALIPIRRNPRAVYTPQCRLGMETEGLYSTSSVESRENCMKLLFPAQSMEI
jgi:hypothetical protein